MRSQPFTIDVHLLRPYNTGDCCELMYPISVFHIYRYDTTLCDISLQQVGTLYDMTNCRDIEPAPAMGAPLSRDTVSV